MFRIVFFFILISQISLGQQVRSTGNVKNEQSTIQDDIKDSKSEIIKLQNKLLKYRNISDEEANFEIDLGNIYYEVGKFGVVTGLDQLGNRKYGVSYTIIATQTEKYTIDDRSEKKYNIKAWKEEQQDEINSEIERLEKNIALNENTLRKLGDEIENINKYWSVYNRTLDVVSKNIFEETMEVLELTYSINKKGVGKVLEDINSFYSEADLFEDFKESKEEFELSLSPYIKSGMSKESAIQMVLDQYGYSNKELDSVYISDLSNGKKYGFEFNQSDLQWILNINELYAFSQKEYCRFLDLKDQSCPFSTGDKFGGASSRVQYNKFNIDNIEQWLPIKSVIQSKNFRDFLVSKNIELKWFDQNSFQSFLNVSLGSSDSKIKLKLKDGYIERIAYLFYFEKNNLIESYFDLIRKVNYSQILGDIISEQNSEFSSYINYEEWKELLEGNSKKNKVDIDYKIGSYYEAILELRESKLIFEKEKIRDFAYRSVFNNLKNEYNYTLISFDDLKNEINQSANYYSLIIDDIMLNFLEKDFRISENLIINFNSLNEFSDELKRLAVLSSLSVVIPLPPFGPYEREGRKAFNEVKKLFSKNDLDFIEKLQNSFPSTYTFRITLNDPVLKNLVENGADEEQIRIYLQSINFSGLDGLKEILKSDYFKSFDLNKITNYATLIYSKHPELINFNLQ
tara:strand:- start:131 stop:2182 length:2052 start_codon:yes stop_codon:yes gene_type:complete